MPQRTVFYPLGFPASIASNSQAVLEAAQESWGAWRKRFDERPVEVRCLVTAGAARRRAEPPEPVVRAQQNLLIGVADRENYHCCDTANGFACAWVSEDVVSNSGYFRYHFLEAMTYCLLDTSYTVSVHAACVALGGRGVLLAGDSGAGKTSLAYACARRGWTYTSDDASALVVSGAGRRVIGNPGVFRFRDSAGGLFPEFRGLAASRRGHGKPTIEIRTDRMPTIRTAAESEVGSIVFLSRKRTGGGPAEVSPVTPEEAFAGLYFSPWPPELPSAGGRRRAVRRLLGAPAYRMRYRDLDGAVDCLEQLVRGGLQ